MTFGFWYDIFTVPLEILAQFSFISELKNQKSLSGIFTQLKDFGGTKALFTTSAVIIMGRMIERKCFGTKKVSPSWKLTYFNKPIGSVFEGGTTNQKLLFLRRIKEKFVLNQVPRILISKIFQTFSTYLILSKMTYLEKNFFEIFDKKSIKLFGVLFVSVGANSILESFLDLDIPNPRLCFGYNILWSQWEYLRNASKSAILFPIWSFQTAILFAVIENLSLEQLFTRYIELIERRGILGVFSGFYAFLLKETIRWNSLVLKFERSRDYENLDLKSYVN